MLDWLFSSLTGWLGIAGMIAVGCFAVAWFIPPLRNAAMAVAGVVLSAAAIYAKGNRDRAKLEQRRKDEAVRKARAEYDRIERRPDTPADVEKRLKDGTF